MSYALLALGGLTTLLFGANLAAGYAITRFLTKDDPAWHTLVPIHFAAGLGVATLVCLVHCLVLIYFIGTGKAIKEAVEEYGLDPAYAKRTRRFKARTFPFATFGMLSAAVGTILAGAVLSRRASPALHGWVLVFAFLLNAFAFYMEYRAALENSELIRTVNAEVVAREEERDRKVGAHRAEDPRA